jgi:hypothetical protein
MLDHENNPGDNPETAQVVVTQKFHGQTVFGIS